MARANLLGLKFLSICAACSLGFISCSSQNERGVSPTSADLALDGSFLDRDDWDDGKAEVSIYLFNRTPESQNLKSISYYCATLLVKQSFDFKTLGKPELIQMNGLKVSTADVSEAFQWGFFDRIDKKNPLHSSFITVSKDRLRPARESHARISFEGNSILEIVYRGREISRSQL